MADLEMISNDSQISRPRVISTSSSLPNMTFLVGPDSQQHIHRLDATQTHFPETSEDWRFCQKYHALMGHSWCMCIWGKNVPYDTKKWPSQLAPKRECTSSSKTALSRKRPHKSRLFQEGRLPIKFIPNTSGTLDPESELGVRRRSCSR